MKAKDIIWDQVYKANNLIYKNWFEWQFVKSFLHNSGWFWPNHAVVSGSQVLRL